MKIFCDSASVSDIVGYVNDPTITGFTTNPTLMKKAGITDYFKFASEAVVAAGDKPISFEVFSTDENEMKRQARLLAKLGKNVFIKITPMNYDGSPLLHVIKELSGEGIQLNVTAVFTLEQVKEITECLDPTTKSIISIFSGRIADAGVDPEGIVMKARRMSDRISRVWEILWASPREVFNIIQAERSGAHIITATPDILAKRKLFGKDLTEYSLETTRMFINDARAAGYTL
jgi:transaldolase